MEQNKAERLNENVTEKMCSSDGNVVGEMCSPADADTYREYGVATKGQYLKILEFRHFVEFFSFNKIGENHKEKLLVQRVTVVVALDLGTGNTKNPEYESE